MGTRADFYVGKGKNAEWIGSIGYDGYPDGIEHKILESTSESEFRIRVNERLDAEDGTMPDQGWPWPWETSRTTDYSYWFADGKVWASCFGSQFFDPLIPEPKDDEDDDSQSKKIECPDFSTDRMAESGTSRSGIIAIGLQTKRPEHLPARGRFHKQSY